MYQTYKTRKEAKEALKQITTALRVGQIYYPHHKDADKDGNVYILTAAGQTLHTDGYIR